MELVHSGKVRDVYADGDELILVASDRVSVYDVVLPTRIPDKGKILTRLSLWWFERLADIVPNHIVSATDVPDEWAGRAVRCRRLAMLPVEWIARGHLAGPASRSTRSPAPSPASRCRTAWSRRPGCPSRSSPRPPRPPRATTSSSPTTTWSARSAPHGRPAQGRHAGDLPARRGPGRRARHHHRRHQAGVRPRAGRRPRPRRRGAHARLVPLLAADQWRPGRPQHSLDKQYVRDWSSTLDWDRTPPGPAIPDDVVEATRARYIDVYERLTGRAWTS